MKTYLHELPLDKLLPEWDRLDEHGTNLAAIRALCLTDLYYLLVKVCHREDMLHPWVLERCREVEQHPNGYLDLWAREHFKSSIITFGLTIQDILNNPEITVGIFSETYDLASKFLQQIKKEFEQNTLLKKAFPDVLWDKPTVEAPEWNTEGIIVKRNGNPKEPTVEAQGLLSLKVGAHYDLIVYDDVITIKSVSSPEMVKKITDYVELSTSQGKEGGVSRYIGTRYSYGDTYQTIIDLGRAIPRIYPATDDGTPTGNPVLFSEEYWEKKKIDNTQYNLACQFLQNPNSGLEQKFDIRTLEAYEVRPLKLNVAIVMDPAKSKKKTSDRTAILVIGIGGNKRKYLLDGIAHRMTLAERWEALKTLHHRWNHAPGIGTLKVYVETYGSGEVDVDYFRDQMKRENVRFSIETLTSSLNSSNRKIDRIERIEPDLRHHMIFLPYPTDKTRLTKAQLKAEQTGNGDLIARPITRLDENRMKYDVSDLLVQEMQDFPYGKHDDVIDAFSRIYDTDVNSPTGNRGGYALPEQDLI